MRIVSVLKQWLDAGLLSKQAWGTIPQVKAVGLVLLASHVLTEDVKEPLIYVQANP